MRTLVIPDIHNNSANAEAIISKENPDRIVFLGDYFDSFGDESDVDTVSNTAMWLADSVQKSNRIHLYGNHDIWYSNPYCEPWCGGNSWFKSFIIRKAEIEWDKIKFHYWLDHWLCTHAGLSNIIYEEYKSKTVKDLMNDIESDGRKHPLVSLVGEVRGGIEGQVGGIS